MFQSVIAKNISQNFVREIKRIKATNSQNNLKFEHFFKLNKDRRFVVTLNSVF